MNDLTAKSFLRSKSPSLKSPLYHLYVLSLSTMQSIELYSPNSPNLHLTSLASTYSLSEDVNPLNYQLTTDDFFALVQADGQVLYTLDPSTTTSLFWALHRLARYIVRAASHGLHNDPSVPFASKAYIPQSFFDRICMERPAILTIQDHHFPNPLYGYTTRENLAAWYRDFQTVGRVAVQWIRTAQRQTLQFGPGTGWDWEARHGSRLEFPNRRLLTDGGFDAVDVSEMEDTDSSSKTTSEWTTESGGNRSNEGFLGEYAEGEENRIVLHPTRSAYSKRYPDFNPFAGQTLIDNGYVDNDNNQCRAMIIHPSVAFDQNPAYLNYYDNIYTVPVNEEGI